MKQTLLAFMLLAALQSNGQKKDSSYFSFTQGANEYYIAQPYKKIELQTFNPPDSLRTIKFVTVGNNTIFLYKYNGEIWANKSYFCDCPKCKGDTLSFIIKIQ